jgi:hypothetical protein
MNRGGAGRRVRAQRWYRFIVRLYPAAHRRAFGDEMVQMFGDHYRDAVGSGRVSRWRFWRSVLADAGRSLVTEYIAAIRAGAGWPGRLRRRNRRWRQRRSAPYRRDAVTRTGRPGRGGRRGRRRRYRRPACRPVRVVAKTRRHRLVYRGRFSSLVLLAVLLGAVLAAGTVTGHTGVAAIVAGAVVLAWLAYRIRLDRLVPAGPHGDGPAPPGGASVREPRRPLPMCPGGSAARPRPDQEPPGQAVALI